MARRWDMLARAVRTTCLDTPLDDLCQLILVDKPKALNPIPGVRFIYFTSRDDLFYQLGFNKSPIPLISELNPTAKEFVPLSLPNAAISNPEQDDAGEILDAEDEIAEESGLGERDAIAVAPSEEMLNIANWCTRRFRQRVKYSKSTRSGNHFFDSCLVEKNTRTGAEQLASGYLKYYLGPLPHLLAWLEHAAKRCVDMKKKQSQRLSEVSHEAYDQMMERIDLLS
jgi:hypothetical protein